ncbi:K+-transporting ATPase KdpF subunit [Bradyrhizobium sp. LM4.3]
MMDILMLGLGFAFFAPRDRLHLRLRTAVRERTMIFDYALAGTVSFGLLIYLTYALLRPERF